MLSLLGLFSQAFDLWIYTLFFSRSGKAFLLPLLMMRETVKFLVMSQAIATSLIKEHLSKQNFT